MAKNQRNALKRYLPELLLVGGILLVVISTSHRLLRARSLSVSEAVVSEYIEQQVVSDNPRIYPTHIEIPWYIDVAIDPHTYSAGEWTVSENHASYLTDSAIPGEPGNIIIYGHNKREIMGNLRALKGHEQITLTLSDGSKKQYQVESIKQVSPTQTDLLTQTDSEVLTLYTCSGFLDSQRFVVRAKPSI